jgi:hypothetical protein
LHTKQIRCRELHRQHKICYSINMNSEAKRTQEQMEKMKAQLKGVVDINYKRYNNEYMDHASKHMWALKQDKEAKKEKTSAQIAQETAEELYPKLSGRIIL